MPDRITFKYDRRRGIQVVLWLLKEHGGAMDKLKLVKLVFLADREHLARYGRPIVGGTYCAMPHGPVSSELLDDINEAGTTKALPFDIEDNKVRSREQLDEDWLSESDIEVLEHVNAEFGRYDTFHLRDITHTLKAWRNNFREESARKSFPLPYEDFFLDLPDDDILNIIREDQEAHTAFE